jgi:KaiC/GvpD/RAD55 family RecA-like ATPase
VTQRVLTLGDRGLDLVLSGGVRWVERVATVAGASILVRGPAGSGKTLVGVSLARSLARQLNGPVAYGCVELLPSELDAQVQSLFPGSDGPAVRYAPFNSEPAPGADVLLVSLLELDGNPDRLGDALDAMWGEIEALDLRPRVVVIDSLIDGYGIGSNVSREFADAICKLTARWGIALILLEECATAKASPWVYAVDTVIELGLEGDEGAGSPERWLRVPKHRFGPSDIGPHRFVIESGIGVTVFPRTSVWLEPWAAPLVGLVSRGPAPRLVRSNNGVPALTIKGPIVAIHGSETSALLRLARSLKPEGPPSVSRSLWYDFQSPLSSDPVRDGATLRVGLSHPYLSAERLLSRMLEKSLFDEPVASVLISDVRTIRSARNTDALRSALSTFCTLMRAHGVPVLMIETAPFRFAVRGNSFVSQPGLAEPDIVHFSDVAIEVVTDDWNEGRLSQVRVTDLKDGSLNVLQSHQTVPL